MKTGLIYQPCGLGDILFLQKLAHHIQDQGYKVYWPVIHEYKWLNDYIEDFEFVSWDDDKEPINGPPLPDSCQFPFKEKYIPGAPTEVTDELYFYQGFMDDKPTMAGKYNRINLPFEDWSKYVKFKRNKEKEDELFYNVLGLKDDDEYVFINRLWCKRPKLEFYPGIPDADDETYEGFKVVENQMIDGFSIFDWCKVYEKASGFYMVETSINYVLESPQLFDIIKTKPLYLKHRWNNYSEVAYLHKLPWNYL